MTTFVTVKIITGMGTQFYGQYTAAYEFLAFFGILADAGLFVIAVREMSRGGATIKQQEKIFHNILSVRLLMIVLVVLLARLSAQVFPGMSPIVRMGVWITSLSMGLTILAGTLSAPLQSNMKIQYHSLAGVLGKLLFMGLVVFIARSENLFGVMPFYELLWAGVFGNLLLAGLTMYFTSRVIRIALAWDFAWIKKTLKQALPYGLALVLQTLYLRVDILIILWLLGEYAVGLYGVGARILESMLVLGIFFGRAILPKLSKEEGSDDKNSQTLGWGILVLLFIALPLVIGGAAYSDDIVLLLSSPEFLWPMRGFASSGQILTILLLTIIPAYLNQLFTFSLIAKNRQNLLLFVNGAALALNAGLNIYLLPRYGLLSAAWATVVSELLVLILLGILLRKYYQIQMKHTPLILVFLANITLFLLYFLTPIGNNLVLGIIFGGLVYGLLIILIYKQLLPR